MANIFPPTHKYGHYYGISLVLDYIKQNNYVKSKINKHGNYFNFNFTFDDLVLNSYILKYIQLQKIKSYAIQISNKEADWVNKNAFLYKTCSDSVYQQMIDRLWKTACSLRNFNNINSFAGSFLNTMLHKLKQQATYIRVHELFSVASHTLSKSNVYLWNDFYFLRNVDNKKNSVLFCLHRNLQNNADEVSFYVFSPSQEVIFSDGCSEINNMDSALDFALEFMQ